MVNITKLIGCNVSTADAKSLPRSLPRDVMGVSISSGFVYTDASNLPRSGTVRLDVNAFGYDINALEVIVTCLHASLTLSSTLSATDWSPRQGN